MQPPVRVRVRARDRGAQMALVIGRAIWRSSRGVGRKGGSRACALWRAVWGAMAARYTARQAHRMRRLGSNVHGVRRCATLAPPIGGT